MTARVSNEDEWEYEYSTTETETFYVDIDLSSVNGVIKSKNAGDRKSLKRPEKDSNVNKSFNCAAADEAGDVQDPDDGDDKEEAADEGVGNGDDQDINGLSQPQSPREPGLLDDDNTDRAQILDLDTTNPIVSYKGQIYSCTWHDMLGTTMFISKHQEAPFHEPEESTDDYDLIGTSRLKLVGQRARIIPKAGSKKRRREESEEAIEDLGPTADFQQYVPDGRSLGTITRTNPKTNIEIKQQASFLERLMEVKRSRGETDTVRTFVDRNTVAADARKARQAKRIAKGKQKEKEETAEQRLRREINELNKRVVKGDNEALERLQEIYADMEEVEDEEDEVFIGGSTVPKASALVNNEASTDDATASDPRVPPVAVAREGASVTEPLALAEEAPHVPDSYPNGASGSAAAPATLHLDPSP